MTEYWCHSCGKIHSGLAPRQNKTGKAMCESSFMRMQKSINRPEKQRINQGKQVAKAYRKGKLPFKAETVKKETA